ncbi:MAG TPA: UDP-N-acetylglucosamine 2-epimerase, partial [Candidatus Angelobacter sp.]|nr:UDP-N-acetylglucosamine 2-epimerase [Candidatus Angelobacter sp.]
VKLVGTQVEKILDEANRLLDDREAYFGMARASNPFGDGFAAKRIVEFLRLNWASKAMGAAIAQAQ